jgi:aryl-alcohol dehydrogenase-like predicted oxidoreductase
MRYVDVAGERISVVGLGTWQFGSREWGYGDEYAERGGLEIANKALDLGLNLVDTAEIYGFGRSERILSGLLRERGKEVFLATKIAPLFPVPRYVEWRLHGSLRRLGVGSVDLYQLHNPNPAVPLSQQMRGMAALVDAGLVRHAGVSNYSLACWQAAERAGGPPVFSNQIRFNLVDRRALTATIPWAQANDRLVIAYSPLAQGLLSARYDRGNRPGAMRAANSLFLPENLDRAQPLFDALRDVAASHDATPAQVALAWVVRHPNVVAIPGASSVAQVESNVAAAELELTDEEAAHLLATAEAFRPVVGPRAVPALARERFEARRRR